MKKHITTKMYQLAKYNIINTQNKPLITTICLFSWWLNNWYKNTPTHNTKNLEIEDENDQNKKERDLYLAKKMKLQIIEADSQKKPREKESSSKKSKNKNRVKTEKEETNLIKELTKLKKEVGINGSN